jgi:hypothetical protein
VAAALAVALYVPWMAFQRLYDPPGDRLLRWHLAADLREVAPPFPEVLVSSYRRPLTVVAKDKARNLAALSATPWRWGSSKATPAWTDTPGRLRTGLSSNLFLAPVILLPVLLVALLRDRRLWLLAGLSAGTALVSALLEHGGSWEAVAWTQHTSYVAVIAWTAAGAVAALSLGRAWRRLVIAAHAATFAWLWLFLARDSALTGRLGADLYAPAWVAALLGCGALVLLLRTSGAELGGGFSGPLCGDPTPVDGRATADVPPAH